MKKLIFLFFMAAMSTMCSKDDCRDQCPTGYTGCDCDQVRTPVSITITRVTLLQYPPTQNGSSWDDFSQYADPYFALYSSESGIVYESVRKDEVPFSSPVSWDVNIPINSSAVYVLIFLDYDSNADHSIICDENITPYIPGNGFPDSKLFVDGGSTFRVEYTYQF